MHPCDLSSSERIFSAAGRLVTKLRNSLLPANIDASIFLATNTMLPGARFPVAATIDNAVQQGAGLAEELEEEECLPPLPDLPLLLQSSDDEE